MARTPLRETTCPWPDEWPGSRAASYLPPELQTATRRGSVCGAGTPGTPGTPGTQGVRLSGDQYDELGLTRQAGHARYAHRDGVRAGHGITMHREHPPPTKQLGVVNAVLIKESGCVADTVTPVNLHRDRLRGIGRLRYDPAQPETRSGRAEQCLGPGDGDAGR